jgi:hypothetical protein
MTTNKKSAAVALSNKKTTVLITSDMVLDLYAKAKKSKGAEKKSLMEKVIFLSQHLNRYTPIALDHYQ